MIIDQTQIVYCMVDRVMYSGSGREKFMKEKKRLSEKNWVWEYAPSRLMATYDLTYDKFLVN